MKINLGTWAPLLVRVPLDDGSDAFEMKLDIPHEKCVITCTQGEEEKKVIGRNLRFAQSGGKLVLKLDPIRIGQMASTYQAEVPYESVTDISIWN